MTSLILIRSEVVCACARLFHRLTPPGVALFATRAYRRLPGRPATAGACLSAALGILAPVTLEAQEAAPQSLPAPSASSAASDDAIEMSVFTITEEKNSGYESFLTTSGSRTVENLKNLANSISVMNAELIADVGALTIEEMSRWFVTGEENPHPDQANRLVFRGIANQYAMRDGWIWYSPIDSFSVERVELVRGPNAFLYGEADLGGANNTITKQAKFTRDHQRLRFMTGSDDLYRGEIDINRKLNGKLALRTNVVYQDSKAWYHHGMRKFGAFQLAVQFRPTRATTVNVWGEHGHSRVVNMTGMYQDRYSRTATSSYAATAAGLVYVPGLDQTYALLGRRFATGPTIPLANESILPREANYRGPSGFRDQLYDIISFSIEQNLVRNLHLLVSGNYMRQNIYETQFLGQFSRAVTRDLNPTLPNGQANPYFNELYTEYNRLLAYNGNIVRDIRISAVYDLDLGWMRQRIVANAQQHQDNPGQWMNKKAEFIDPAYYPWSGGTFNTAPTLAAYQANRTIAGRNKFYRRYYLKDGDRADWAGSVDPIPGQSVYLPDYSSSLFTVDGMYRRRFYTPSMGFGASGSYFKERLFTMVGWRQDEFRMVWDNILPLPYANPWEYVNNTANPFGRSNYRFRAWNLGAVGHVTRWLSLFYNYAQTHRPSFGDGNFGYVIGTKQGIPTGEGTEMGMRLSLLRNRLDLSVVRYDNYQPNARITPLGSAQQNVKDELFALYPNEFNSGGTDVQKQQTRGYEMELIANPTKQWRLILNGAKNEVETNERLPQLKYFQTKAREEGHPTPLLDAFLLTVPDKVPNAGFTKYRANFFTRYDFASGWLKSFYVGGGYNWRDKTYRGNYDLNQDGVAESLWSPSYGIVTLLAGYRTKLFGRPTTAAFNMDNVIDKVYFRSGDFSTGSWGAPRSFRFTLAVEL